MRVEGGFTTVEEPRRLSLGEGPPLVLEGDVDDPRHGPRGGGHLDGGVGDVLAVGQDVAEVHLQPREEVLPDHHHLLGPGDPALADGEGLDDRTLAAAGHDQVWSLSSFKVSYQVLRKLELSLVCFLAHDLPDGPRQPRAFWADSVPFADTGCRVVICGNYRGTRL